MVKSKFGKMKRLFADEGYFLGHASYLSRIKKNGRSGISKFLNEKRFTMKDTDSSYRVINHWFTQGLLGDDVRESDKGWRKFSVVDLVWLTIIRELREYGLSLEKIKKSYKTAFYDLNTGKNETYELEFAILMAMMKRPIYGVVFPDGWFEIISDSGIQITNIVYRGDIENLSYISISINKCLKRIFPKKDFGPEIDLPNLLSKSEENILEVIREGNFDEVSIIFKNGEIDRIDTKETSNKESVEKIMNMIQKTKFGDFKIKIQDGQIVFTEANQKKKVIK